MTTSVAIRRPRAAPGPRGHALLGSLPAYRQGRLRFFTDTAREYGGVVRVRLGPRVIHLVSHPDGIKHILQDNHRNYRKGERYDRLVPVLGRGLLTSEGEFWLRQRRLAQPAFHRQRLGAFATIMTEATAAMLARWEREAWRGQPLDIAAEMMRLTFAIVGRTLFSADVSGEADAVGQALTIALREADRRIRSTIPLPERLPTARNRRVREAIRTLDGVVYNLIAARRDGRDAREGDLLAMLLAARDEETGEGMSDRQLRDEVMTIVLAGHETTANALAWTWYLLSQHPEAEEHLRAEVATALSGRTPGIEDLAALSYTRMVIEEAMRLYPPAWAVGRTALVDDEIGGYRIPAGKTVVLSPYVTQRLPQFWDDPERFAPERFRPERVAARPRFAYFPFGGGPRLCIGNGFAMLEAQLIVAMVAGRYRLRLVPGQRVEPEPMVTLRPRGGLPMTLHA